MARRHGQFVPGDPRINRRGRPKKTRAAAELVRQCRQMTAEGLELARRLLNDEEWARANGSSWAAIMRMSIERGYGRPDDAESLEAAMLEWEERAAEQALALRDPERIAAAAHRLLASDPEAARLLTQALVEAGASD